MIRLATHSDADTIASIGREFCESTANCHLGIPYNYEDCKSLASFIIDNGVAVLAGDYGILLMLVSPYPFNKDYTVASEIAFFIKEEKRGGLSALKMIRLAEKRAIELGANIVVMASIEGGSPPNIEKFYNNFGYNLTERAFAKII